MENWRKNLIVLWIGTFLAGVGFSEIMPFLTIYVKSMNDTSEKTALFLSGIVYSASYVIVILVSPFWGKIADRYGRRAMLLRCSLGMAVTITLMGLATNVWQLILLRCLQGLSDGYTPNAQALIILQAPKKQLGKIVNVLTTGYISGNLIGPIVGGVFADLFSIRITFFMTGFLLFTVFLLSMFFVTEDAEKFKKKNNFEEVSGKFWEHVPDIKYLLIMLLLTTVIQAGNASIVPVLTLFIKQILDSASHLLLLSGIAAALPGISNVLFAFFIGKAADKWGVVRILILGIFLTIVVNLLQSMVVTLAFLFLLRFMLGIADASTLPEIQLSITQHVDQKFIGRSLSYNQSANALGGMLGTLVGTSVSAVWGIKSVFLLNALLISLIAGLLIIQMNKRKIFRKT
ncbi:major facilitator superfamily permease [Liquorilactobacillus aquaticus DSM 21051]|uniref:Major facilitator superfamily permease n=1 Tax=Liquorilactobacillus aquaticus DSM 21051 TaxID=1423725 RepID=A0A0R2D4M1_9LACO|nr:MFS transporter [Liquorilactobacillus aquaticus]KRM95116.1 major facilitator superfamily permease [Liquorilactobacillus aquaticus DSM 21051]